MNHESTAALTDAFREAFGADPDGLWAAPGRANLIGEHTDYNDGFVLPFAIAHSARVAVRRTRTAALRIAGRQEVAGVRAVEIDPARLSPAHAGEVPGWSRYVAGAVWALNAWAESAGHAPLVAAGEGYDVVLDSDVPIGAGLSSSAAIECAVVTALAELAGLDVSRETLVLIAQRAENEYVGAPTGILDQSASLLGEDGSALFLDCRSRASRPVPLALEEAGLEILAIDTKVSHAHESGGYGQLRAACEAGAAGLGVQALRDVSVEELEAAQRRLAPEVFARVKHIVTENQRVLDTVRELEAERVEWAEVGRLLTASHASMRDDFGNSCPEMDVAVASAVRAGAHGARMTGGGFGGTAIALVPAGARAEVTAAVEQAFAQRGFTAPAIFPIRPSAGARRLVG